MNDSKIWLIWLAVMWENIARNIANNGHRISVYNRTGDKTSDFISKWYSENLLWTHTIKEFIDSLESPKKIMIMVKAWDPVDAVISSLKPFLNKDDLIVDLWNSFYRDTQRRYKELKDIWINFIWSGVSWWEEWALNWPSIMPGWDIQAYKYIENILADISAKDFSGWKCVSYIWNDGAWHYVKMVHNGIEYAIMQMMAEWYDIFRKVYKLSAPEISRIFQGYNNWKLNSYLFEISSKVLSKEDMFNKDQFMIDNIRDTAWAKWTWLWTSIEWLEKWLSVSSIIEATLSRAISSNKDIRTKLSTIYWPKIYKTDILLEDFIKILETTLFSGMLISYAQWLALIKETSKQENRNINLSEVTRIRQWGCIIRAKILSFLTEIFAKNNTFDNILELSEIQSEISSSLDNYKTTLYTTFSNDIPTPSLSAALNYFLSITSQHSSANFIQWLRDYFWAHTYERDDREWSFHTNW